MNQQEKKFVQDNLKGSIHQLSEWGEIQTHLKGREKYWILTEKADNKITAYALIIKQTLPFGLSWLYTPRGPLSTPGVDITTFNAMFSQIRKLAKKEKAVFFRFEPPETQEETSHNPYTKEFLKSINSNPSHAHYQPESTLLIDLSLSEDEILKQMKPKGRYNIKVAQKHDVKIRKSTPETIEKDTETFYNLFSETTNRDRFSGHPLSYYQNLVKTLGSEHCAIYTAYYSPKITSPANTSSSSKSPIPLSSAIVTYFKDTATYYYGASSNEHRNTMSPYLLHWQIIQDAKAAGYKTYDLFGIAPTTADKKIDTSHPWAGVTSFKQKFGGEKISYFPAQEIVYKPFWYVIIKATKRLKKAI